MSRDRGVCIGVDTSCYTTSLAAVDAQSGALLSQRRKILPVPMGQCGLRQSDALYQHVLQLPDLFRQLLSDLKEFAPYHVVCVSVSKTPRDVEDSYMPVFRAGTAFANVMADSFGVPLYETCHQTGHLLAATAGSGDEPERDFLAIHLSGGTCEMLRVKVADYYGELIGATDDISAGQLMDRVGVKLGLAFPAGVSMERLAASCGEKDPESIACVPVSVRGLRLSFAGPASALLRQADAGEDAALIALRAYSAVARTLCKWIKNASVQTGLSDVLLMGGVASSAVLRRILEDRLQKARVNVTMHYADPALASDNAVGVAIFGARRWNESRCNEKGE